MQKKIYVVGMFDDETAGKVDAAVKALSGINTCVATPSKAQVLVDFDEAKLTEDAINTAIKSTGVEVVG